MDTRRASTRRPRGALALTAALMVTAPGAALGASPDPGALPQGAEVVALDPADFVAVIDNPWWPMPVGRRWVYSETDADGGAKRVEVTVTDQTRSVAGITATVVHDQVTEGGDLVEDTFDWYAQDRDGNVWYLGEATQEFEGGKVVSTAGTWEAGVDGAQAGVIMPADPQVGMAYRQEFYAGHAEDAARVLSIDEWVEVPAGSFREVLLTHDHTPLTPDVLEYKLYARGVGPVLTLDVSGGSGREELDGFEPGGPS